jgi:hypothetical protein
VDSPVSAGEGQPGHPKKEPVTIAMIDVFKLISLCRRPIAAALFCAAITPAFAQQVVVMVNGEPITAYDIDQRAKFNQLTTHKAPVRQEVIDELIDEKLKIKEGRRWGIEVPDSDINAPRVCLIPASQSPRCAPAFAPNRRGNRWCAAATSRAFKSRRGTS